MKLDKLRLVRDELASEFRHNDVTSDLYYYFGERWHRLDDEAAVEDAVVACLEKATLDSVAHPSKSRTAWFACADMDCCVSLEFATSPRVKTRKQSRERIGAVLTRASNAYRVAHHPLTQLLAKDAFRALLQAAIDDLEREPSPESDIQGVEQQVLAVLALDIDHFKQVNDSHGHLYGDQVLKTFGIRLERASAEWNAAGHSTTRVTLGHPSGEEFLVLVRGPATRGQLIDLGNFLRKRIEGEALPSEAEWAWLKEGEDLAILVPPPLHERTITTSIGLAVYVPSFSDEAQNHASQLLDQADTALYRAKAGGRNQVILFDDILTKCGRVLEQDALTKIIAIDIGKNVGVTVGQEFRVFPPGFTGARKFQVSDGRSTRTIGTYPRFNSTRITVFDVQPELSFAFVSDAADSDVPIEVRSQLEAVPLGSIGHLLPHASKFLSSKMEGVRVGDVESVLAFIKDGQQAANKPYAVVLRFMQADQYLKRYGPVALNAALARLFRETTGKFHAAAAIGVLDSASVVMVGRGQTYSEERIGAFVNELGQELPELGLVGGVFCNADIPKKKTPGHAELNSLHAVAFARFAASDHALSPKSRVTHFNYDTAVRMLKAQRESGHFSQGLADFGTLRSLGVENASLYNRGGLLSASLREHEQAADLFERAATLDGDHIVFKSNFATAATTPGQVERALKLLSNVEDPTIEKLAQLHPYGYFSYTKLLAQAKLEGLSAFNAERFAGMAPRALSLNEGQKPDRKLARELIEKALATP